MEKRRLGKTGYDVSVLGFGAAPIGYLKTEQGRVIEIIDQLLQAGVNLIDTAASYEGSEELVAEAIGDRRDELVIVSKCGSKVAGLSGKPWSDELITKTVDRSLRRLRTDRLDVMLLHSCDLPTLQKGEALGALVKARQAGKIRFAGYSGDNDAAAYAATLPDIAVIETSISIADQHNIDIVLPTTRAADIGVMAKRPIANAAWKHPTHQPGLYANYAQTYHDRLKQMNLSPDEFAISGPPERAWPELALRFTLSQPGLATAIIGTTNPDNVRANIAAAQKGPLPDEVVKRLRAAFHAADPERTWMGQT